MGGWSSVMVQSPISGQFPSIHAGTGPGNTETRDSDVTAPHYSYYSLLLSTIGGMVNKG